MKVALDISAALAGDSGIKFYVEGLLEGLGLAGAGHEFLLYTVFWRTPERLEAVRLPKAPNFRLEHRRVPQRLLLPAEEILGLRLVEGWLKRLGADLVHGLGNILPPLRRLPGVLTVHHVGGALDTTDRWSLFYFNTLAERSVKRADAVIAVSEFSRREAVAEYGIPESRAHAVHEGPPLPVFSPGPEGGSPAVRGLAAPYILSVGGILERKNLVNLLHAFARLRPDRPQLRLVLAGKKGQYFPVVARAAEDLRLGSDVAFLEGLAKEELVGLYRNAAVLAFPSLLEGFGFPVLEAMACGTPVVASTSGAIPEVAGDAAVLVDAEDPEALAQGLARVLDDAGLASDLRRRGFERVRRFSWERTARETLAVYERALRGRTGR